MKYALIEGSRIAQVSSEPFPVAPPLVWVEVADDTTERDTYIDGAAVKGGNGTVVPEIVGKTYKADIWRRATDEEAATIDAQISAQPIKLRNLFRDCDHLSHADPYFSALKAGFVAAFGQKRADELLAATG